MVASAAEFVAESVACQVPGGIVTTALPDTEC